MLAVLQVAHLVTWHKQLCYFGAETVGPFFIYCPFLFKTTWVFGMPPPVGFLICSGNHFIFAFFFKE